MQAGQVVIHPQQRGLSWGEGGFKDLNGRDHSAGGLIVSFGLRVAIAALLLEHVGPLAGPSLAPRPRPRRKKGKEVTGGGGVGAWVGTFDPDEMRR